MRDIKFRALIHGKLEYVDDLYWFEENNIHSSKDCPLMQFTGLTDKNGVEIYEGDIVKTTINNHFFIYVIEPCEIEPNGQLYAIKKLDNCSIDEDENGIEVYSYQVQNSASSRTDLFYGRVFEVVGNVFENTQLLEK